MSGLSQSVRGRGARSAQAAGADLSRRVARARGRADLERLSGAHRARLVPAVAWSRQHTAHAGLRALRAYRRDGYLVRPAFHQYSIDPDQRARRIQRALPVLPGPAALAAMLQRPFL